MMLLVTILVFAAAVCGIVFGAIQLDEYGSGLGAFLLALGVVCTPLGCILCPGFKVLNPNEAVVLTLFGKYYGTIKMCIRDSILSDRSILD